MMAVFSSKSFPSRATAVRQQLIHQRQNGGEGEQEGQQPADQTTQTTGQAAADPGAAPEGVDSDGDPEPEAAL